MQAPVALDCCQGHILVACGELQLLMLRANVHGDLRRKGQAYADLVCVRELSLVTFAQPLLAITLIGSATAASADNEAAASQPGGFRRTMFRSTADLGSTGLSETSSPTAFAKGGSVASESALVSPAHVATTGARKSAAWRARAPTHCVLLRWGGLLSLLDLDTGTETQLFEVRMTRCDSIYVGVVTLHMCHSFAHVRVCSLRKALVATCAHRLQGVEAAWLSAWPHAPASPPASAALPLPEAAAIARAPSSTAAASTGAVTSTGGVATVEMPWWIYTPSGMHLVFPSTLRDRGGGALPGPRKFANTDDPEQELQFDREVFPIGVSLADAAIIGVTQRLRRFSLAAAQPGGGTLPSAAQHDSELASAGPPHAYCLLPVPQSQPVLPCLLRRLLLQGNGRGARLLAQHHQCGPHFSRSLEWLLFSSLDHDFGAARSASGSAELLHHANSPAHMARSGANGPLDVPQGATAQRSRGTGSARHRQQSGVAAVTQPGLLQGVFDLARRFPQWRDIVVNVSRKTDATMWPLLFSVVGQPSSLLEQLLRAGQARRQA